MCSRSSKHEKWWVCRCVFFFCESVVCQYRKMSAFLICYSLNQRWGLFLRLFYLFSFSLPLYSCRFVTLCIFITSPLSSSLPHLLVFTPLFTMFVPLSPPHSCRWLWRRSRPYRQRLAPWRRSWAAATLWTAPPLPSLARSYCCCRVRWSSFRRRTTGTISTHTHM